MMKLLLLFLMVMCLAEARVLSPDPSLDHLLVRKAHRLLLVKKATPPNTNEKNMATRAINKAMGESKPMAKKVTQLKYSEEEEEQGKRFKSGLDAVIKVGRDDMMTNISSIKGKLMRGELCDLVAESMKDVCEIVRRMQGLVYVTVSYVASHEMAGAVTSTMHLLGFVTAHGACVWVLLVWRHVVPMALPRQQLGLVQARVYPVYFKLVAFGVGLAFLSRYTETDLSQLKEKLPGYNLVAVLLLVLANMLFLEPKVTKLVMKKVKVEKEEGRGGENPETELEKPVVTGATSINGACCELVPPVEEKDMRSKVDELDNELKRLNKFSAFLNILTLIGLTLHLVHLAHRLQACKCP
ncbi:hypothetical protein IHE45_05G034500 [Dioscorea alata]|uniref:Uncharacterized protein n=1 Tax=Dioscorea alata TaxID=55571 RepID=A0ACB7W0I6_DIOAL|nr:hypothetical protein IHE45_05G034500 [Dioscorea alata]